MTEPRFASAHIQLLGLDSNAGSIMGRVTEAMKEAGATSDDLNEFRLAAMSGSYDDLLRTVTKWVTVDELQEV